MSEASVDKWSKDYINSLPDSCFAHVSKSGQRSYPYKDLSGVVDGTRARYAAAKVRIDRKLDLTPKMRELIAKKISMELASHGAKKSDTKFMSDEVTFGVAYVAKVIEVDNKKKILLSGTLMDDTVNKNFWRLKAEEHSTIAKEVDGTPIKMQHAESDWQIVGTGLGGSTEANSVLYEGEITDKYAVEKFTTGTWNAKNMGVSPRVSVTDVICSICGKSAEHGHIHQPGEKYGSDICFYDVVGAHLKEFSLTSNPAYRPSAGTIDYVSFAASLDKKFISKNTEEKSMEKDNGYEAVLLDKETRIEELRSEKAQFESKIKTLEADVAKKAEEVKTLTDAQAEMKKSLKAHTDVARRTELEKRISDKGLVAKILTSEYTDEQFKAELEKIDTLKASLGAATNAGQGSAPTDDANNDLEARTKEIGRKFFGSEFEKMLPKGAEGV